MNKITAILMLLASIALSSCASTSSSLQRATAENIGTDPGAVEVSNINRSAMEVNWTAIANGKKYKCSADDMVRRPHCREGS